MAHVAQEHTQLAGAAAGLEVGKKWGDWAQPASKLWPVQHLCLRGASAPVNLTDLSLSRLCTLSPINTKLVYCTTPFVSIPRLCGHKSALGKHDWGRTQLLWALSCTALKTAKLQQQVP